MTSASIRMLFKRFSWHVFCSCHSENTFFCSCHSAPKWPRAEYTVKFHPPPQNEFSASAQSSFCACVPGPQLGVAACCRPSGQCPRADEATELALSRSEWSGGGKAPFTGLREQQPAAARGAVSVLVQSETQGRVEMRFFKKYMS